jgi:hypothetical protein
MLRKDVNVTPYLHGEEMKEGSKLYGCLRRIKEGFHGKGKFPSTSRSLVFDI